MPGKQALVNPYKCHPEKCDKGICIAAQACSHKLIKQEDSYDIPMFHPSICQGCDDCARACPIQAIQIVRM